MCVKPFGEWTEKDDVTIKMKVESSSATVYHSFDYSNWEEVENVEYDDGVAVIKSNKGLYCIYSMLIL